MILRYLERGKILLNSIPIIDWNIYKKKKKKIPKIILF